MAKTLTLRSKNIEQIPNNIEQTQDQKTEKKNNDLTLEVFCTLPGGAEVFFKAVAVNAANSVPKTKMNILEIQKIILKSLTQEYGNNVKISI